MIVTISAASSSYRAAMVRRGDDVAACAGRRDEAAACIVDAREDAAATRWRAARARARGVRSCAWLTRVLLASLLAVACSPVTAARAADAPAWLRQAASVPDAASTAKAAAVVLVDEEDVTVSADGRLKTVRRYAIRLHDAAGRGSAIVRAVYFPDAGRAPELRGWLLRANGAGVRELGSRETVDAALVNDDIYNDVRVRRLGVPSEIAAGEVFGAEVESDERALFSQIEWELQERWPVRAVRRRLTLPAGWDARSVTFNGVGGANGVSGAAIEPQRQGTTWTWQLSDLPEVVSEPDMPPYSAIVPRVAVSFFGPGRAASDGQFSSWSDVSAWLSTLSDAPAAPSEALTRRARELASAAGPEPAQAGGETTANGATAPSALAAKIGALARHVQGVQYVSIQTGLGRGGGYRPHAAGLVFDRNYGDCKDKATLLRAMLSAIGVRSWLVSIYSGDPDYVRDEFPSPQQFNHAIVAIALPASIGASSELTDPALGRLLFFDPTAESTPFGDLPLDEQGSLALIVSGQDGRLVRMPISPASAHRIERTLTATLDIDGSLNVDLRETSLGSTAARARAIARALGTTAVREYVERRSAATFPGGRVLEMSSVDSESKSKPSSAAAVGSSAVAPAPASGASRAAASTSPSPAPALENDADEGHSIGGPSAPGGGSYELRITVRAARYAQRMSDRLLLFRPPFGFGGETATVSGGARTRALVLDPRYVRESLDLTLPSGLVIDELPPPVTFDGPYGRYTIAYTRPTDAHLQVTRFLEVPRKTVPAAEHAAAKAFFDQIRAADAAPVVLKK